jgi:DNA-binding NtrC family response regulator
MRPVVLVGSLSQSRLIHYQRALENYGMKVKVISKDEDYFQELCRHSWSSLLMEYSMIWGTQGLDDSDNSNRENWRDTPLVLFASPGPSSRPAESVRMPVLGLFQQFPSRDELVTAIKSAWKSDDSFVVEAPDLQHESCHAERS